MGNCHVCPYGIELEPLAHLCLRKMKVYKLAERYECPDYSTLWSHMSKEDAERLAELRIGIRKAIEEAIEIIRRYQ